MKIFPSKTYKVTLDRPYSEAFERLKEHTDPTKYLYSDFTSKSFRGIVNTNKFKIISSEIGLGAVCVLEGKYDDSTLIIHSRINNAFKVMMSILMLMPIVGIGVILLIQQPVQSFSPLLGLIISLLVLRFVFIEFNYRLSSKRAVKRLKNVLGIIKMEVIKGYHNTTQTSSFK